MNPNKCLIVFSETKSFVELLFNTLETQEYVLPPPKMVSADGGTPPGVNPPAPLTTVDKPVEVPLLTAALSSTSPTPAVQINGAPLVTIKREPRKSESDREEKEKERRPRSR